MTWLTNPQMWITALTNPQVWISLITLTVLEIVLGIDNIIFISILAGKLPPGEGKKARLIGLMLAMVMRIILLSSIVWLSHLTDPLFYALGRGFSWKDLVLIGGGGFLLTKSVREIHISLEEEDHVKSTAIPAALTTVVVQIALVDIIFSLDSVITAVGLAQHIGVMISAVILAMIVMLAASGAISSYVNRHPTIKMLALSFLILVGVVLIADGFHHHIEKGYIYFAMAFSFAVEMLNIKMRAKRRLARPVNLRSAY
jgi:predicted tellurium resistance membrane protein TerC